jgi:hypothetical protein
MGASAMLGNAFYTFLEQGVQAKSLASEFYLDPHKDLHANILRANNLKGTELLQPGACLLIPDRNTSSAGIERLGRMSQSVALGTPYISASAAKIANSHGAIIAALTNSDNFGSILKDGADGVDKGASYIGSSLKIVEKTLKKVDTLHRSQLRQYGHLKSPEFFAQRKVLESGLESQLGKFSKQAILKNGEAPGINRALGISSKNVVKQFKVHGDEFKIREVEHALGRTGSLASSVAKVGAIAQFVSLGVTAKDIATEFDQKGSTAGYQKLGHESSSLLGSTLGGVLGSEAAIAAVTFAVGAGAAPVAIPLVAAGLIVVGVAGGSYIGSKMAESAWSSWSGPATQQVGQGIEWVARLWD